VGVPEWVPRWQAYEGEVRVPARGEVVACRCRTLWLVREKLQSDSLFSIGTRDAASGGAGGLRGGRRGYNASAGK